MNVIDIADTINRELNNSQSITSISYWLRYVGIGKLNISIDTSFVLTGSLDFSPELDDMQAAILMELYFVNYFDKAAFNALGANSYETNDLWTNLREGDTSISRISRVDVAKQYSKLKDDHNEILKMLVAQYRANNARPKEERYTAYDNYSE